MDLVDINLYDFSTYLVWPPQTHSTLAHIHSNKLFNKTFLKRMICPKFFAILVGVLSDAMLTYPCDLGSCEIVSIGLKIEFG